MSLFDSSYLKKLTTKHTNPFHKYRNHTSRFIEMLINEKDNIESSFIAMIIGATGSGKTALAFIIISILMYSDPTRTCKLFRVPSSLLENIKKYAPKSLSSRFKIIQNLREITEDSILLIDEGLLNANGKEALKLEFRAFEKGLGISRQLRIIALLNTQSDGVIKSYRKLAHIIFYKQISVIIEQNTNDKFIKRNSYVLKQLKEKQTLFQSGYKKFKKWGRIEIDLDEIIPWYNFEISKSYAKSNFDQQFIQDLKQDELLKSLAEKALKFWGADLLKSKAEMVLSAWLKEQVSFETYYDVKTKIREILSYAVYKLRIQEREKKNENKDIDLEKEIIFGENSFADLCSKQFGSDQVK